MKWTRSEDPQPLVHSRMEKWGTLVGLNPKVTVEKEDT